MNSDGGVFIFSFIFIVQTEQFFLFFLYVVGRVTFSLVCLFEGEWRNDCFAFLPRFPISTLTYPPSCVELSRSDDAPVSLSRQQTSRRRFGSSSSNSISLLRLCESCSRLSLVNSSPRDLRVFSVCWNVSGACR